MLLVLVLNSSLLEYHINLINLCSIEWYIIELVVMDSSLYSEALFSLREFQRRRIHSVQILLLCPH
jgi:hypothetical protein